MPTSRNRLRFRSVHPQNIPLKHPTISAYSPCRQAYAVGVARWAYGGSTAIVRKELPSMPPPVRSVATDSRPTPMADIVATGGMAGVATAYNVVKCAASVALIDKAVIAGGQSSRNWSVCRQQNRDPRKLPFSQIALPIRGLRQALVPFARPVVLRHARSPGEAPVRTRQPCLQHRFLRRSGRWNNQCEHGNSKYSAL